jgi:hypothetical protein
VIQKIKGFIATGNKNTHDYLALVFNEVHMDRNCWLDKIGGNAPNPLKLLVALFVSIAIEANDLRAVVYTQKDCARMGVGKGRDCTLKRDFRAALFELNRPRLKTF